MTGHCVDCGETLDQFGICPFADPELARLARAPVSCGHSAAENAARVAKELAVAKRPVIQPIWKGVSKDEAQSMVRNFMGIAGDQSKESR